MSKMISDVTEETFEAEVQNSSLPVLVDFWAPWCGPCKMLSPLIDEVATGNEGKIKVVKVNIDEASKLAVQHSVRGIPTLMIFKNGLLQASKVGALTKGQLQSFLKENI